jgi:NADPH-ferrihemoprotein reductase
MATEIFSLPLPSAVGMIGILLLGISLLAALVLNCADKRRKSTAKPPAAAVAASAAGAAAAKAASGPDTRDRATILFGTQTGTAERFAKSLKSQLESKYGASTAFDVIDVEHYNAEERLSKEKLVFFLMATYGDGEPTDNAADFYTWLSDAADAADTAAPPCGNVSFGVFGLGNRQYEQFCAVGKKIQAAMGELGATPVVRLGTGDDDDDIDEDFDAWAADLFVALEASPLLVAGSGAAATPDSVPAYDVETISGAAAAGMDTLPDGAGTSHTAPHLATITAVRELHLKASDRSCIHVELDISGSQATYEAGDHVGVFVENSPEVVAAAAKALGQPLDAAFRLRQPRGVAAALDEAPPPGALTLRAALARYADLLSSPSKAALAALAAFATDPTDARRLSELASIEGRDAYHSYISVVKRSLLEVMQDHPSAVPTLGAFFASVAPRLQPRYYSISSSPAAHPRSVHVTCAVVRGEAMPSGRLHNGVASCWLAAAAPGTRVPVFLRHSTFKLPTDAKTPVVMVGPGTGLAPFRGFIQERAAAAAAGAALGPALLYFGCRRADQDYIYREELEAALANGALSSLQVALSRADASGKKDYVQHHMLTDGGAALREALEAPGAVFYVCGDAKRMAKDVHAALVEALGEGAVRRLADEGRYHKDVW